MLTGESLPREKQALPGALAPGGLGEAVTAGFRGTSVVSGLATAVVVATATEFERGTRRFGFLILQVVIFLVLFVFLVNAVLKRDLLVFFGFLVVMVVGYLGLMELAKGWFYRRYPM